MVEKSLRESKYEKKSKRRQTIKKKKIMRVIGEDEKKKRRRIHRMKRWVRSDKKEIKWGNNCYSHLWRC